MKSVIAVVSDTHAGSLVAVAPDKTYQSDDGSFFKPSDAQLWINNWWDRFWEKVDAERSDADELGVLVNGDMVEGDHHNTPQIFSRNLNLQSDLVEDLFVPKFEMTSPDFIHVVRGTGSHVGQSGSKEESISKGWSRAGWPVQVDTNQGGYNYSWFHLLMKVQDVLIDAAHHGRTGYRPWTDQNAVNLLSWQIATERLRDKHEIPRLAIRSHFHRHFDSYDASPVRVLQTPCWQLKTAYAHQKVTESISHIGGLIVIIEDGELTDVKKHIIKPSRGNVWTR